MVHSSLTVVSIYGHNDGASAIPAILKSMEELPGSIGLLLSAAKPENLPDQIEWQQIGYLGYQQYSVFVMHSLHSFINTDYCLIVQDDGWILNGKNWREEFYNYDYIGAPCHAAIVNNELKLYFTWLEDKERIVIQNGGISLRSKRLLQAPNKYGLTHIPAQDINLWNEDVQLSGIYRPVLEAYGLRFAPEFLAKHFAIEYLSPVFHDDLDLSCVVGHHATSRKLVSASHIVVDLESVVSYREPDVMSYFQSLGYTIEYAANHNHQA